MRFHFRILIGIFLITIGHGSQTAQGAACPYVDQAQQAKNREDSLLQGILKTGDCSSIPALLAAAMEYNQAVENAVRFCRGFQITKQADPSASDANISVAVSVHTM
jgi:hypothetical protein